MKHAIEEITIDEILRGQKEDQFSAEELIYSYMERIAAFDKSSSGINAVLELNPDAPATAAGLDIARKSGVPMKPLHGVPILLKDNINTGDKMHTSAGSLVLADSYAHSDAFLVRRLCDAGAIILGKVNMTEWANFMTKGMPGGYSSRGGQVRNPYGRHCSPGGSSSGSGAAVAANLCAAAVGTETSGSILSPAICNMIIGIKPTVGLISRTGIIPISSSQDTAGPLARTVADAVHLLSAMREMDEEDPITTTSGPHQDVNYHAFLEQETKGVRIDIPRKVFWDHESEAEKQQAEEAISMLADLGAVIVDPADLPTAEELGKTQVLLYEFKNGINAYLSTLGPNAPVKTLKQIIASNKVNSKRNLKYGQTLLLESELYTSGTLTEPEYIHSRLEDLRICRTQGIDSVLAKEELDVLLFPAHSGCAVCARAGYPSITVPTGFVSSTEGDKPYGITISGPAFSELLLIRCAHALEQYADRRQSPKLHE